MFFCLNPFNRHAPVSPVLLSIILNLRLMSFCLNLLLAPGAAGVVSQSREVHRATGGAIKSLKERVEFYIQERQELCYWILDRSTKGQKGAKLFCCLCSCVFMLRTGEQEKQEIFLFLCLSCLNPSNQATVSNVLLSEIPTKTCVSYVLVL